MITAFTNARIFTGEEELNDTSLLVENDVVLDFISSDNIPQSAQIINCKNQTIAPGLIDLQIYGGGGYLFSNDPTPHALKKMTEAIVKSGTTGFMVTLATNSTDVFKKAIQVVRENPHPAILGIHFEGPWLNPVKKGAHIEKYIKKPTLKEVQELIDDAGDVLKMVTLAPEIVGDEIIRLLRKNNIIVSAGHSNATFNEAVQGYEAGVQTATHLFNAMSPMHHRDTGLPGATFLSEHAMASIIADGIHVDFATLAISKKMMGERLFYITDAVEEVKSGAYIHVKQNNRFTLPDGTLSGSKISLIESVANGIRHAGISLEESFKMASTYPSRLLVNSERGKLKKGWRADLIITDHELTLTEVFLSGKSQSI